MPLKDLTYALELAGDAGIKIRGAELTGTILQEAIDAGSGGGVFSCDRQTYRRS